MIEHLKKTNSDQVLKLSNTIVGIVLKKRPQAPTPNMLRRRQKELELERVQKVAVKLITQNKNTYDKKYQVT